MSTLLNSAISLAIATTISATTLTTLNAVYREASEQIQTIAVINVKQTIKVAIIQHAVETGESLDPSTFSTIVKLVKDGRVSDEVFKVVESDEHGKWQVKKLTEDVDFSKFETSP